MPPRKYIPKKKIMSSRKSSTPYRSKKAMPSRQSLVKLIKNVTLKTQETKMSTFNNVHGLLHNVSTRADQNMLATFQGLNDTSGYNNRVGDTVTPIGVKLYMQFRQPADRPNINWKIWILKTPGVNSYTFVPVKALTGNLMLDPVDTEKCTVLKVLQFKHMDNYFNGTAGSSKETNFFRKVWIPLDRRPYSYDGDNSSLGKLYNVAMYAAAYDTSGTLITDNIGTFTWNKVFYFKDA